MTPVTASDNSVPELWAVVPAAGSGSRLAASLPKQYLLLNNRSILQRAIDTLLSIDTIKGVVVVLSKTDALWSEQPASQHAQVMTTVGGSTRAESVLAGLKTVREYAQDDNAMALVHDAARTLTAVSDINRLIERVMQAPEHGGLLASKVQDTLKRATVIEPSGTQTVQVASTLSREGLWQAQTPQLFHANSLLDALDSNSHAIAQGVITDEACAMEQAGFAPALVEALQPNFKITHSRDLDMALALVESSERNA